MPFSILNAYTSAGHAACKPYTYISTIVDLVSEITIQ